MPRAGNTLLVNLRSVDPQRRMHLNGKGAASCPGRSPTHSAYSAAGNRFARTFAGAAKGGLAEPGTIPTVEEIAANSFGRFSEQLRDSGKHGRLNTASSARRSSEPPYVYLSRSQVILARD
jgi:hypothetical protein